MNPFLIFIWKKFFRSRAIFCSFLILGLSSGVSSYAQHQMECDNPNIDMDALLKAESYETGHANQLLATAPMLMRVYFHICSSFRFRIIGERTRYGGYFRLDQRN